MYKVFTRTWWRTNPSWPGCKEPHAGRKTVLVYVATAEEAQAVCENWNAIHPSGALSRRAEYEAIA